MHTRFSFLWSYTIHSTTVAWSASVLLSPEKAWGHRWAKIKSWNAIDGKTDCEAEANWTSELSPQEREPLRHINRHGVTNGHQQSNWQNQKMKAQNSPGPCSQNLPIETYELTRPTCLNSFPAYFLSRGEVVSRRPIGWIGISWNSVNKNSNSEIKY